MVLAWLKWFASYRPLLGSFYEWQEAEWCESEWCEYGDIHGVWNRLDAVPVR